MPASVSAILNNELASEDLQAVIRSQDVKIDMAVPSAPAGQPSISFFAPGVVKIGKLKGFDVSLWNAVYLNQTRGIIMLGVSQDDREAVATALDALEQFIKGSFVGRLALYEIVYNSLRAGRLEHVPFSSVPDLQSMKNPRFFTIDLFEGDLEKGDIRLLPWKQIIIQPFVGDPTKVVVRLVYRFPPDEKSLAMLAFNDLDIVVGRVLKKEADQNVGTN
ncbi:hypothetical protein PQ610_06520 [Tardisphaera miroshnichenkoae]